MILNYDKIVKQSFSDSKIGSCKKVVKLLSSNSLSSTDLGKSGRERERDRQTDREREKNDS